MKQIKPVATDRRKKTRNDVYRFIYNASSSVTKQDIARELNLSLPTVYQNLSELEEAGLIHAAELQKPTGGRPPVGYEVRADAHFAVGVSISATEISMVALDMKRNEIAAASEPVQSLEKEALLGQFTDAMERFGEDAELDREKLLGIGLTVPGVLDPASDTILLSPTLQLGKVPVKQIQERFFCPVSVENDSTSAGIAEYSVLPKEERKKSFACLYLAYGVGGAVFFEGKPWYGENHRSAEFGHMCIVPDGLPCSCGKKGCLEAYIGAFRFSRDLGISIDAFFEERDRGNKEYQDLWEDGITHLAIALSNIRRAFDCDVILGGFMSEQIAASMEQLQAKIAELDIFGEDPSWLKIGKFPRKAGIYGAAWSWIERFIDEI